MSVEPSKRVGDYEIVEVLGRGGMGNVFKVRNVLSDRIEAMKVLLPDLANGEELAERFRREIKLLASLDHPNIAAFRTALTWDNHLVMIMEYVKGMTLATRVARGPLPLGDAVDYTQQVLAALAYAHVRHIIHRDIKPANIMVTAQQVIKLMDFGIARCASDATMTLTGTTLGSLHYMSPEQVRGEPADERSDLYSLGLSLYELVTGRRPFAEDSDYSIMAAQLNKQPKPPILLREEVPSALSDIVMKAVEKEPARRFQSASEFSQALTSLAITRQLPTVARDLSSAPTTSPDVFTAATQSMPAVHVKTNSPASTAPGTRDSVQMPGSNRNQIPVDAATPSASRPAYRGLYMSLGALVVALVLIAAGLYLPRRNVTHSASPARSPSTPNTLPAADGKNVQVPPAATVAPGNSSPSDAGMSSQIAAENSSLAVSRLPDAGLRKTTPIAVGRSANRNFGIAATLPAGTAKKDSAAVEATTPVAASKIESLKESATTNAPAPVVVDELALQQATHDLDLLASRSESIIGSLTALRNSQQSRGLELRGDIASSQTRMQTYLHRAKTALSNRDVSETRKYLGLAETEVTNLEKFLGR
jgi:serine/threonine protein kinase